MPSAEHAIELSEHLRTILGTRPLGSSARSVSPRRRGLGSSFGQVLGAVLVLLLVLVVALLAVEVDALVLVSLVLGVNSPRDEAAFLDVTTDSLLDALACAAMEERIGCSWEAALDQACDLDDPFLRAQCEALIAALILPDPCVDISELTLAGTATPQGPDTMSGDWAGTLNGAEFTGTHTEHRR